MICVNNTYQSDFCVSTIQDIQSFRAVRPVRTRTLSPSRRPPSPWDALVKFGMEVVDTEIIRKACVNAANEVLADKLDKVKALETSLENKTFTYDSFANFAQGVGLAAYKNFVKPFVKGVLKKQGVPKKTVESLVEKSSPDREPSRSTHKCAKVVDWLREVVKKQNPFGHPFNDMVSSLGINGSSFFGDWATGKMQMDGEEPDKETENEFSLSTLFNFAKAVGFNPFPDKIQPLVKEGLLWLGVEQDIAMTLSGKCTMENVAATAKFVCKFSSGTLTLQDYYNLASGVGHVLKDVGTQLLCEPIPTTTTELSCKPITTTAYPTLLRPSPLQQNASDVSKGGGYKAGQPHHAAPHPSSEASDLCVGSAVYIFSNTFGGQVVATVTQIQGSQITVTYGNGLTKTGTLEQLQAGLHTH